MFHETSVPQISFVPSKPHVINFVILQNSTSDLRRLWMACDLFGYINAIDNMAFEKKSMAFNSLGMIHRSSLGSSTDQNYKPQTPARLKNTMGYPNRDLTACKEPWVMCITEGCKHSTGDRLQDLGKILEVAFRLFGQSLISDCSFLVSRPEIVINCPISLASTNFLHDT